jgi:hypothetical protein
LAGRQKKKSSGIRRIINSKERSYPEGYEPYYAYVTEFFNISRRKADELKDGDKHKGIKPKLKSYKLSGDVLVKKSDCLDLFHSEMGKSEETLELERELIEFEPDS